MSSRAGLAAVLSFVIPGLGQIYNGHFIRAAFWVLVAFWWTSSPTSWPFDAGFWVWMTHFIPAATAYHKARQIELIENWRADMSRKIGGSGRLFEQ